jgi:hypothetical protein
MAGKTGVLGENLPQCHFIHRKPHMLCPDANPDRRIEKPATNRLTYGTTYQDVDEISFSDREDLKFHTETKGCMKFDFGIRARRMETVQKAVAIS